MQYLLANNCNKEDQGERDCNIIVVPSISVILGVLLENCIELVSQEGEVIEGDGYLHVPLGVRDLGVAPLLARVETLAVLEVGVEVLVPEELVGGVIH